MLHQHFRLRKIDLLFILKGTLTRENQVTIVIFVLKKMQIKGLTAWVSPGRSGLELANYMFVFEHFLFITTGWGVCIGSRPAAANCSFNAKWGLTRSALKKILWLFTLGFSDAPRLGSARERKCICKLNPWEEMTTFGRPWTVLTTTLLIAAHWKVALQGSLLPR